MLTATGADETLAVAVVDVAQNAAADHGREDTIERRDAILAPDAEKKGVF